MREKGEKSAEKRDPRFVLGAPGGRRRRKCLVVPQKALESGSEGQHLRLRGLYGTITDRLCSKRAKSSFEGGFREQIRIEGARTTT